MSNVFLRQESKMSRQSAHTAGLALLLVGLGLISRLLPHPPNLAPIAAIALFAGVVLPSRLLALFVPLCSMLLADALIGTYDYRVMAVVYSMLALPVLMSSILRHRMSFVGVVTGTVAASLAFFLLTNLAVWNFGTLYDHTGQGLWECYVSALPFFKNTLAGDLTWCAVLFGIYGVSRLELPAKRAKALVRVDR